MKPTLSLTGCLDSEVLLRAKTASFNEIAPIGTVVHNGGKGCFRLFGARTYQLSLGGIRATGTVTLAGQSVAVTGEA
jgi:hypothetical protein